MNTLVITDGCIVWATWAERFIGSVRLLTPSIRPDLTLVQLKWLARAWEAADEGRTGGVEYCVRALERLLWPKGFDPHAAWRPAAIVSDAPKPKKAKVEVSRPWPILFELEEKEELASHLLQNADRLGLTAVQKVRLRYADSLLFPPRNGVSTRTMKGEARRIANAVAAELGEALSEAARLEQTRGGEAKRLTGGRMRMTGRDGLVALYDDGGLTGLSEEERARNPLKAADAWIEASRRLHAGLQFRMIHERLEASLGSQLNDSGVGGGARDAVAAGFARAQFSRNGDMILGDVMKADRSGRAVRVLRAVAGEGRSLRSQGSGTDSKKLNLAALLVALDVAVRTLRIC